MRLSAVTAAPAYTARGWRILPLRPRSKQPATAHGVDDATTDLERISAWWSECPTYNVGIACGAPGPLVLDIDDETGAPGRLRDSRAPLVRTARGWQLYFAGDDRRTIRLPYGELRGTGSYVVAPPSIHPTGAVYEWRRPLHGRLPSVPSFVTAGRVGSSAGCGAYEPLALVPHGRRHAYLLDLAVRFARGGITDANLVRELLKTAFATRCEQLPPLERGELDGLVAWCVGSRIATQESESSKRLDDLVAVIRRARKETDGSRVIT